jgi:hypothetical protein
LEVISGICRKVGGIPPWFQAWVYELKVFFSTPPPKFLDTPLIKRFRDTICSSEKINFGRKQANK